MVGVSDDVNEYAVALRATEDKLRRCPKRVRLGQAAGYWERKVLHRSSILGVPSLLGHPTKEILFWDCPSILPSPCPDGTKWEEQGCLRACGA